MNCWNNSSRILLPVLDKQIQSLAERIEFLGQNTAFFFLKPLWQMTQNFMGRAEGNPKVLTGEIMDQEKLTLEATESSPGLVMWINFYCMVLALFLGDYDRAEEYSSTSHEIYDHSYGGIDSASVLFFESMTLLAQARRGKRGRISGAKKRIKRLRLWAKHSPVNFLGKLYLLEAELAVATGDKLSAMSKYTSSIALSRQDGFIMQEAQANELAGKFCLEEGEEEAALPFLRESYQLYEQWGGTVKMRHLEEELKPLQIC
jgi:tetratricopeptide (TPR) repeat protein